VFWLSSASVSAIIIARLSGFVDHLLAILAKAAK
jgi:hypothetical protein